ncbi:VOC family protein [Williamsia sp. CHRR-6]|uniref:VOC family protein n=1 Tax=Williamsia sp. CHRR-6 TaxID=2835871 RepID=UPI001BDA5B90|nr:VOC family protein [Williamsia sp. CHRR-6]MBT0568553.1 VOC family protein [Williamsia sp. CHRR-6]
MTDYTAPAGAPIWFDLMSTDTTRVTAFYGQLFGWDCEPPREEFGGYQNFTLHGRRVAGLSPYWPESGAPANTWAVYLHTTDAAASVAAAEAAGATAVTPPMTVGEEGTMAVVTDPAGASIGFWQPNTHAGFTEWGVHGAPYWFECMSHDYAASTAFYPKVVDTRLLEIGTGGDPEKEGPDHYSQLMFGDVSYGGIMAAGDLLPAGTPSHWSVYVTVDDVAATVAAATALGGSVLMAPEVTPYGTLASITDPCGAVINLGHPPIGM